MRDPSAPDARPTDTPDPDPPSGSQAAPASSAVAVRGVYGLFVIGLTVMCGAELAVTWVVANVLPGSSATEAALVNVGLLLVVTGFPVYFLVMRPLVQVLRQERAALLGSQHRLMSELRRQDFEGRLHRALSMADEEPQALFTASYGVAEKSSEDSLDGLLRIADGALYAAKQGGRDRVVIAREHRDSATAAETPGAEALPAGDADPSTASPQGAGQTASPAGS